MCPVRFVVGFPGFACDGSASVCGPLVGDGAWGGFCLFREHVPQDVAKGFRDGPEGGARLSRILRRGFERIASALAGSHPSYEDFAFLALLKIILQ